MFQSIGSTPKLVLIISVALGVYFYYQNGNTVTHECPIVNTTLGGLQGLTSFSRDGREYSDYRGIPFAKPPVGELRFEVGAMMALIKLARNPY